MNFDRPMPPHRVPTLTEVVVWPEPVAEPAAEPVIEPASEPAFGQISEPFVEPAPPMIPQPALQVLPEPVGWGEPVQAFMPVQAPEPPAAPFGETSVAQAPFAPLTEPVDAQPAEAEPVEHASAQVYTSPAGAANAVPDAAADTQPLATLPTESQLTQRVLADIQRQVELMLDYRLREALAPLLARATDGLVREARQELASTLRDVVARAVAQELSRHRTR